MRRFSDFAAATVIGAIVGCSGIHSASAQSFWSGKNLVIIVGASPGGGYDMYARVLGRHIRKYIPGNPTAVVQNMPGAGSKLAAEYMASSAPRDGAVIAAIFPGGIAELLVTERSKRRYEPTALQYIGTANSGTRLCVTRLDATTKTFADARQRTTIVAGAAPGDSTFDYPVMLNKLAATKFKVVSGYKGTQEMAVSVERGETEGICGLDTSTFDSVRPDWIPKRQVNALVQLGLKPDPEMSALGIPSIWDFVPPENKDVMELILSQQVFQRPFIAPPATPADRVGVLRDAFMATMKDAEFLAEAKTAKLAINPLSGADVAALVDKLYASPKALVDRMAEAMRD